MKYTIGQTIWRLNYQNKAKETKIIGVLVSKNKENSLTYHYQTSELPIYEDEDLKDISPIFSIFFIEESKLFPSKEALIASL